ncbi:hypothetical protein ACP70R_045898 [Stipagrostis hirtigluma subsp. patula]
MRVRRGGAGCSAEDGAAPLLTKTHQLVNDLATDHIVSWGDDRCPRSSSGTRPSWRATSSPTSSSTSSPSSCQLNTR